MKYTFGYASTGISKRRIFFTRNELGLPGAPCQSIFMPGSPIDCRQGSLKVCKRELNWYSKNRMSNSKSNMFDEMIRISANRNTIANMCKELSWKEIPLEECHSNCSYKGREYLARDLKRPLDLGFCVGVYQGHQILDWTASQKYEEFLKTRGIRDFSPRTIKKRIKCAIIYFVWWSSIIGHKMHHRKKHNAHRDSIF